MDDPIDEMVVAVRAGTSAVQREMAALRAEMTGPLAAGADAAGRAIERALTRAVVTGKLGFDDLKRVALNVMNEIARAAIQAGIQSLGGGSGGGGGGGGTAGGLLAFAQSIAMAFFGAPGRATGGPVSAGRAYRVGERGPELFVPTSSGRIDATPDRAGRAIAITVNVRGEAAAGPQRLAQSGRQIARAVRQALIEGEA